MNEEKGGRVRYSILSHRFTYHGPKEIQRNICTTDVALCEDESVPTWTKARPGPKHLLSQLPSVVFAIQSLRC